MAQWHRVDRVPGDRSPRLFKTLWKWFRHLPTSYIRPDVQSQFLASINLSKLESDFAKLEILAKSLNCPVVFCHNDLLSGNIIFNPDANDVSFIDYEYGSFNYRSFDIANHFCEYAGFDCDYSLYPDESFQQKWIREYLISSQDDSSDENVAKIVNEVRIFTLVAHFFWGVWALVQSHVSDINFDYMGYAVHRFNQFKLLNKQTNNK